MPSRKPVSSVIPIESAPRFGRKEDTDPQPPSPQGNTGCRPSRFLLVSRREAIIFAKRNRRSDKSIAAQFGILQSDVIEVVAAELDHAVQLRRAA